MTTKSPRWRRMAWMPLALCLIAATMSSNAGSSSAQDVDEAVPEQVVIFVIDLSGSMNEPFDGDRTKLDVAKEAFTETFQDVADDAMVGLRVYGDQIAAAGPDGRESGCLTDSRLVVPVGPIDRELLISEVQGFEARGDTMIALALREADNDIPDGTLGTVVLFSDGRDECFDADLDGDAAVGPSYGEDPCEVARSIAGDGTDLRIDRVETVGFGADAAAELELRCIADATGGSYTPIETAEDARNVLPEILADIGSPRVAERLGGEPIAGTPSLEGAPEFSRLDGPNGADGRFTDTIEMNSENWYHVPEYGPGRGTFTATAFGLPAQEGIDLGMRLFLPETDNTREGTFFENRNNANAGIPRRPTVSIRCPGCFISGGPNDAYWVLSLTSENPELGGTYDLEILTEGPGFGGLETNCVEPQSCWYEQQIAARTLALEELQTEIDQAPSAPGVPQELLDERDAALADAVDLESQAATAVSRRDELSAQVAALGDESTSLVLPLALGGVGLAAGAASMLVGRRKDDELDQAAEPDQPGSQAPVGHITTPAQTVPPLPPLPPTPPPIPPPKTGANIEAQTVLPTPHMQEAELPEADALEVPEAAKPATPPPVDPPPPLEVPQNPPGWYDDPDTANQLRWWDGEAWTAHVHTEGEST